MSDLPEPDDVHAAAAVWVFKLEAGLSAADRRAFDTWISRSPAHAEVLARQAAIMHAPFETGFAANRVSPPRPSRRRIWLGLGVGAGVAACAAMIAVLLVQVPVAPQNGYAVEIVSAAEVGNRAAPDGSQIWVDARSSVQVAYTGDARTIHLEEGGVFVEVKRDPGRPFGVQTDRFTATAVGTAFEVQWRGAQARVRVLEGVVRLSDASGTLLGELQAGKEAALSETGVWTFKAVSLAAVATWRSQRLVFADARLDEVVEAMNLYRESQFLRVEDELASTRVSGVFSVESGSLSEPGQSLADSVGAQLRLIDEDELLIAR